jgi:hypothetical protein
LYAGQRPWACWIEPLQNLQAVVVEEREEDEEEKSVEEEEEEDKEEEKDVVDGVEIAIQIVAKSTARLKDKK